MVLLRSGLYFEVVLIKRWSQMELPLHCYKILSHGAWPVIGEQTLKTKFMVKYLQHI